MDILRDLFAISFNVRGHFKHTRMEVVDEIVKYYVNMKSIEKQRQSWSWSWVQALIQIFLLRKQTKDARVFDLVFFFEIKLTTAYLKSKYWRVLSTFFNPPLGTWSTIVDHIFLNLCNSLNLFLNYPVFLLAVEN